MRACVCLKSTSKAISQVCVTESECVRENEKSFT